MIKKYILGFKRLTTYVIGLRLTLTKVRKYNRIKLIIYLHIIKLCMHIPKYNRIKLTIYLYIIKLLLNIPIVMNIINFVTTKKKNKKNRPKT